MTSAFYELAREVDGFDEKLEKFKDELFAFCEQLGYKTVSYVYSDGTNNRHFVKFTIKDENNSDYDVILFIFGVSIKNKMSYLYLDETVRSLLKQQSKDDVFIHLKRMEDRLFDLNLDSKLIEYKKLADAEKKVIFGGRLGEYKYYDMDATIASVLDKCEKEFE